MTITFDRAVKLVKDELERDIKKFPTFPTDVVHAAGIVAEEAGELSRQAHFATYESNNQLGAIHVGCFNEAVQVAATAIRFMMATGNLADRPSEQKETPL